MFDSVEESTETQPRHHAGGCALRDFKKVIGARESTADGREMFTKMCYTDSKADLEVATSTQRSSAGLPRKRKSCWDSDSSSVDSNLA